MVFPKSLKKSVFASENTDNVINWSIPSSWHYLFNYILLSHPFPIFTLVSDSINILLFQTDSHVKSNISKPVTICLLSLGLVQLIAYRQDFVYTLHVIH